MSADSVPFVDLGAQYADVRERVRAAIDEVLAAQSFIKGPFLARFERSYAEMYGLSAECAVGCSSGTSALMLALAVAGIGAGDEVIVPANTFIATAEAVCHVGARPVYVDIDRATHSIDPIAVASALTPRTRAIIPVHLYGHPADMSALMRLAEARGLLVVEDCAQAHLARDAGRLVGTFGRFGTFSFFPAKNLGAYGDAGMVICADPGDAARVRMLADHGRIGKYEHEIVGYNHRMDALQAAVLWAKLDHLEQWTERRRVIARRYDGILDGLGVSRPAPRQGSASAYHLYVIEVDQRDRIQRHLTAAGIASGIHYPIPLHLQPAFAYLGYRSGDLPEAEAAAQRILSLPMYPELRDDQIDRVCSVLEEVMETTGETTGDR